ncbi:alpha/beta hydrolase [Candidatus Saccharibacteria bacterium]|nr:alpha/beta hydrolase [Candidatus Saccharibacteria bacterium]
MVGNKNNIEPSEGGWTTELTDNGSVIGSFKEGLWNDEKTPIVLIPGIGENANSLFLLANSLRKLDQETEVVTIDSRRARNRLGRAASIGAYGRLLKDAAAKHLGDDRPIVLGGHSLGGLVAQDRALNDPDWIEALVLMSTFPLGMPPFRPDLSTRLKMASFVFAPEHLDRYAVDLFGGDFCNKDQLFETLGMSHEVDKEAFLRQIIALGALAARSLTVIHDRPENIAARTLVICGTNDPVVPHQNSLRLHELLPNSSLVLMPEGGHMPHLTRARKTAGYLNKFKNAA